MKIEHNDILSEEYFNELDKAINDYLKEIDKVFKIVTIDEEEFKKRCEESNNKEKENGKC